MGFEAGQYVTGSQNVALGAGAGRNVSGSNNFGGGSNAGSSISGSNNVCLGTNAGNNQTMDDTFVVSCKNLNIGVTGGNIGFCSAPLQPRSVVTAGSDIAYIVSVLATLGLVISSP